MQGPLAKRSGGGWLRSLRRNPLHRIQTEQGGPQVLEITGIVPKKKVKTEARKSKLPLFDIRSLPLECHALSSVTHERLRTEVRQRVR